MMKRVLKVIALIVILFLLAVPAVYTNTVFGYLPIITALLLSIVSAVYLLIMKRSIVLFCEHGNAQTTRGQTVRVDLQIKNKSFLMCGKAKAEVFVKDYLGNDDSVTETVFTLDARKTTDFTFDVLMNHIGIYTAGIRNMKVYGLLGIASIKIPFQNVFTVMVLPQTNDFEVELTDDMLTDSPDAASFSENDGFDYTGVREYAIGDSMKRIHWKLSAHTRDYMTKINETGLKSDMTVVLDIVTEKNEFDDMLSINDKLIETSVSLMNEADKLDVDHSLLFVTREKQLEEMELRSDSDSIELIRKIHPITAEKTSDLPDASEIIMEELHSMNRSANILVVTSRVTEELLQSMVTSKSQQRNMYLYLVLKPDATSADEKKANEKIRLLDEYDISYEVLH